MKMQLGITFSRVDCHAIDIMLNIELNIRKHSCSARVVVVV